MARIAFILANYAIWVLTSFFFFKLLAQFVSPKKNLVLRIIGIVISFFVVYVMVFPDDFANVLGTLLMFSLMMLFCFKGNFSQRTAVVLIILPLIIAVNFLIDNVGIKTYLALGGVLRQDMGDGAFDASYYYYLDAGVHLFYNILRAGFWFTTFQLFKRQLPKVKKLLTKGMWNTISVICLAPLACVVSLVFFTPKTAPFAYPAMISSVITIFGILLLTGYIANITTTEMENRNLRIQQTYYNELEKSQNETEKLRHDMNNHLGVIATFIESGEKSKAASYYKSLTDELIAKHRMFCKNSIVNAVINAKYNKAIEQQIDCFFNIDLGNMLSIDDISLCSIFANALDNAIEACTLIPAISKRSISLKTRHTDGYFSCEITNTKMQDVIEKNGVIQTHKKDKKKHGYGLSNIQDIVESYNGVLDIVHTEKDFSVTILIEI